MMLILLFTINAPLVNVIVAGVVSEKPTVSPGLAFASAWRNEPVPLSLVLVTVMVAARALCTVVMAPQSSVIRLRPSRVFISTLLVVGELRYRLSVIGYWLL